MDLIEVYRNFNITRCEHGGFHYLPTWSDGSDIIPHANTVNEAKELIDDYYQGRNVID